MMRRNSLAKNIPARCLVGIFQRLHDLLSPWSWSRLGSGFVCPLLFVLLTPTPPPPEAHCQTTT